VALDEADQLADRVVIIDRGPLVADGTPDELKADSMPSVLQAFAERQPLTFMVDAGRGLLLGDAVAATSSIRCRSPGRGILCVAISSPWWSAIRRLPSWAGTDRSRAAVT
jgi:hypothetical protein